MISLALPVAFMIEHVYVLPVQQQARRPALRNRACTATTDTFKFGFTMMVHRLGAQHRGRRDMVPHPGHHPEWSIRVVLRALSRQGRPPLKDKILS
ncbi:MAG: hypothetical protein M0C28_45650 [Candidatus Moduliflexus flocculans]|nr:hypothetical protein [Candidatus Moduliflexus flocculans]